MAKKAVKKISTLGSRITSIVSLSLVLLILGILGITAVIATSLSHSVRDNVTLIVKFDPTMPDSLSCLHADRLKAEPYVASLHYITAQQVFADEASQNPEILDFGENPFSAECEIVVTGQYISADSVRSITDKLQQMPMVDEVVTQLEAVEAINKALHKAMLIMVCSGAVLLIISLVLIFNTVSLSVYSRRFIIHAMQLVGATASFVRRPFVLSGVLWGLISGCISAVALFAIMLYARTSGIEIFLIPGFLTTVLICLSLPVLGILICGVSARMATNRYIGGDDDMLYR